MELRSTYYRWVSEVVSKISEVMHAGAASYNRRPNLRICNCLLVELARCWSLGLAGCKVTEQQEEGEQSKAVGSQVLLEENEMTNPIQNHK